MGDATWSPFTALSALDAVAIDCETTGLDARSARIVQLAAVHILGGAVAPDAAFDRLVDPGVPIPPATSKIHGIIDEHVRGAPAFKAIAADFNAALGNRPVVGHSIGFDLGMLKREYAAAGIAWQQPRALDIRLLGRIAAPTLAEHDLDRLCAWLGVTIEGRHTALGDARATAQAFVALVPLLRARGIRSIAEAEAACVELAEKDARAAGGLFVAGTEAAGGLSAALKLDTFAYRHRVADVMSAPPVVLEGTSDLQAGVAVMIARGLSSVFVRLPGGAHGIVTERDALRALHDRGADAGRTSLAVLAKTPLLGVDESDFVFRAIGRMERLGIRHLAVRRGGQLVGALTPRNLLRNRATASIVIGDGIAAAATPAQLASCWAEAPRMAQSLLAEGTGSRAIANVLSEEICALTRRAAELAVESMAADGLGAPPAAFAVLVLGSAGRGESLLAADQDNAIVYAQGQPGGPQDLWFEQMATRMCDTLDQAGVVFCKGGVMAKTAAWRHSREGWEALISSWVRRQKPQDLLNVDIFFDAVPVHGDTALADAIMGHAFRMAKSSPDFLMMLTELARQWRSPVTLMGGFQKVDGRVDLKKAGLMPIFTGARVLALRHGVEARSTADRLRGVLHRGIGSSATMDALHGAHAVLLGAVLQQQVLDGQRGIQLSPKVDVDRLDKGERRELRQSVQAVREMIDLVSEGRL